MVWYISSVLIGQHTSMIQKRAFESRVSEFLDFKVPFPDICILESDPEHYNEEIERWATSLPTVLESQSLLPRRGRSITVYGPSGCTPPKVLVNKPVQTYMKTQEDFNKLKLFIEDNEVDIEDYLSSHPPTVPHNPVLEISDTIDLYSTPVKRYILINLKSS